MNDRESEKLYKIGQAAEEIGVKPYVLRFWETEFPQLEPVRKASGQRLYTERHLELVRRIRHLLHERGMTIDGARRELERDERSGVLREVEAELLEIRRILRASAPKSGALSGSSPSGSIPDGSIPPSED